MKIWSNFYTDLEIPEDYDKKRYKNLRKTKQPNALVRYEDYLLLKELWPIISLIESLCFDGRYYGAEMKEEFDQWGEYMYWVVFEKQRFFKNLGVKYD